MGKSLFAATGKRASGARLEVVTASPNWRDDEFVNPIPRVPLPFWEFFRKRMAGGPDQSSPDTPPTVVERTASDFEVPPESGLRITWLGHSTFLVEIDGARVLIDPMWAERSSPVSWAGPARFHPVPLGLEDLPPIDAVVFSHDHYDHLDHRTIEELGDRVPLYAVPLGVGAHLEHWGVPADRIVECDWWGEVTVGELKLTATPARHYSGRGVGRQNQTLWSGWALAGPEHRVYYSGDTGLFPGFADIGERLGPFDAVLIEIGAYNAMWADIHLGPEQAVEARLALGSGVFFPAHWGTFDLAFHSWTEPVERLLAAAAAAHVRVVVPRPGERIEPASPPSVERWWPSTVPWETAEQAPVISSGLTNTD